MRYLVALLLTSVAVLHADDDADPKSSPNPFPNFVIIMVDDNAAERMVKNLAIGIKNYLFVGGLRGGHDAAVFCSLVNSAKANGVEPFEWLRDVFTRLPAHRDGKAFAQAKAGEPVTSDELDALLPDRWLATNPRHVWTMDTIRRKERQAKEDNRRRKRRQ